MTRKARHDKSETFINRSMKLIDRKYDQHREHHMISTARTMWDPQSITYVTNDTLRLLLYREVHGHVDVVQKHSAEVHGYLIKMTFLTR